MRLRYYLSENHREYLSGKNESYDFAQQCKLDRSLLLVAGKKVAQDKMRCIIRTHLVTRKWRVTVYLRLCGLIFNSVFMLIYLNRDEPCDFAYKNIVG